MKRNNNRKNKKGNAIDQQQQQRHLNSLPGPSSSTTVSSLEEDAFDETALMGPSTSTACGQQQNCSGNEPKEVFIDRWKKEWKWLANIYSDDDLERVRQENNLGTKNDSGKHSWFGCKTNKKSKKSQAYKHCKYRALYAPEKEAIFYREEHNHPIKKANIPSTVTNAAACSTPPRNTTTSTNNGPTTRARSTRYSTLLLDASEGPSEPKKRKN